MLKKLLNWIKSLFSLQHCAKQVKGELPVETVSFSIVLPKSVYTSLEKLGETTVTKSSSVNVKNIAFAFADFKTVQLTCKKNSNSSKEYMITTLTCLKKEKGKFQLSLKKTK